NLFSSRGLGATKITDIAREAQIAQGLVYHYFSSKEEIFTELIDQSFKKLNSACLMLEQDQSSAKVKIEKAIDALLLGLHENRDTARHHLFIAMATASDATPQKARAIIESENRVAYDVLERIMIQGQKEGTIKQCNPQVLAVLFWTTILGLAIYKSSHPNRTVIPDKSLITCLFFKEQ
ncbi:MAG: TetR/AcrR family transcriptional regulator, partial [Fibrobacter sp.]|nr:TetR/AcrR family transcriptional regulator [Fibrobacter sp.]